MGNTPERKGGGDIFYPSLVVVAVIIASICAQVSRAPTAPDMTVHLGGEYRCIAEALAQGRGFSNPFGDPTGPTAWMPPIFPALIAAMLMAFGSFEAVAVVVLTLQNVVLIYMGFIVLRFASEPGSPGGSRIVVLVAYALTIAANYFYYFRFTHDHVVVGLWVCLIVDFADRLWGRPPRACVVALWGIAGGLSALTAPVLALVWAGLTTMLAVAARRIRLYASACLIACLVVAPWMARNAIVFHQLIPVKSNLAFELYQSQCLEKDGVLRFTTSSSHPYRSPDGIERRLYAREGETEYLHQKGIAFLQSVRENASSYLRRVGNRFAAATVVFDSYFGDQPSVVLAQRLIHPLPFAGLLLTLTTPGWGRDRRKIICIGIYSVYTLPYVIVSYYVRYAIPLDVVKILFCLWGWQAACEWVRSRPIARHQNG